MKKSTVGTLRRLFWEWMLWIVMGPPFVIGVIDIAKVYWSQSGITILGLFVVIFVIFYLGTALGLTRAGGSIYLMANLKDNEDVTVEAYCENRPSSSLYSQLLLVRKQNGDVKYFYAQLSEFDGVPPKVGWTYRKIGTKMVDIKKL